MVFKSAAQLCPVKGRARRKEYWMFILFNTLFATVALLADYGLDIVEDDLGFGPIYGLYLIIMLLPGLAVTVRRLHDTGKSGWLVFLFMIPFAGPFLMVYYGTMDSTPGENKYGSNPKSIIA